MAFFPASSTYPGMLGELYSSAFTAAAFNWLCSPAITELETIVLDWLAKILALPECFLSSGEGGGVIQGSASEATVTVMVAARDRYLRNATKDREGEEKDKITGELRAKLVALGSEMSHSSAQKAALIAGVKYRDVPTKKEDNFRMMGDAFRQTLEQCKREGLIPFWLMANLGTTATCAVDDFEGIAKTLKDYPEVWTHVDAAYAGAALVCEEYQHYSKHLAAFDSFDVNMHKWLLTNFDASCLYVQHRRHLTSALSITPSYLRNPFSDSGLVTDYRDWQIPLGRRFRALKIWFVMRTYGVEGFKTHIRSTIILGELFHSLVLSRPDLFRVLTPPAFALTVFTVVPRRGDGMVGQKTKEYRNGFMADVGKKNDMESNSLTKVVYELINERGEIFLTSSVIGGTYAIRVVSANPKAEEKYVRSAFEIIVRTAEEVLSRQAGNGEKMANGVVED
ncbi:MAG: hypothetical protein M1836_002033 [Candelina mexicana]|nr:MAG: hypothetical protein M1836_002033 [Candelina mexicana]